MATKCIASLELEISAFDIENDVKVSASIVLRDLEIKQVRKNKRKKVIAFAIFQAYLDIGRYRDITHIGRIVNLNSEAAKNSITSYSKKLCKVFGGQLIHHDGEIEIEKMIEYYCSYHCLDLSKDVVEDILGYFSELNEEYEVEFSNKVTFCAAIIYSYAKARGIHLDRDSCKDIFSISPKMLENMLSKFDMID